MHLPAEPPPFEPTATAAAAAPSARPRRRTLGRMVLGALGVVVGVAAVGIAVLPTLSSSPQGLHWILGQLLPELKDVVHCGGFRLGWTGPLELTEVRITPHPGDRPAVAIPLVSCSRGLAAILLTGGDLGDVRIERPRVDVVFDDERHSNLAALFPHDTPDAARAGDTGPRSTLLRLRLEVRDAIVSIAGPWTADPWTSDPIRVRATLGPAADAAWSEWSIEPVQLLTQARLEPPVAQGVLAYIAPVLADATRTGGRFSLRLDGARLPVGRPEAGTLAGVLEMHEVVLGPGPLVGSVLESLPGDLPQPPTIRIAEQARVTFRLAERRIWHDGLAFGLPLFKPGQRLDVESSGSVGLDDGALALKLTLPIPADLPRERPVLAALAGKQISLGIGGRLGAPRVDFDGSIRQAATAAMGDLADRLRERGRAAETNPAAGPGPRAADETAAAVVDLIGGVLEEVAKRRAERRAAEAAGEVPPRRGGLFRRGPPPAETPPPAPVNQPPKPGWQPAP